MFTYLKANRGFLIGASAFGLGMGMGEATNQGFVGSIGTGLVANSAIAGGLGVRGLLKRGRPGMAAAVGAASAAQAALGMYMM